MYIIQHCFICRPLDSTVSEDAVIEPSTVATMAWQPDDLATRQISFSYVPYSERIERIRETYDRDMIWKITWFEDEVYSARSH